MYKYMYAHVWTKYFFHEAIYIYLVLHHQVILPSLHISLGVFKKLFDLFESECHRLDEHLFKLRAETEDDDEMTSTNNFDEQVTTSIKKRNSIAQQLRDKKSRLDELEEDLPLFVLQHTEMQQVNAEFHLLAKETCQLKMGILDLVSQSVVTE